ncbi:nucleotidyltransferase family protein [Virgibacillus sp. NKC19-16]|uniref:nucleotidyltransferase family protein n=1 Tax=Virgibacillus salidurans TaxID=2831673 RepID=UPI001F277FF3|nr:nucleotidyltransferase family protein [Virgibacillus sp. NKC19-16]UJL47098.1 nucleotidyltransferase family protein [Virgibacillus sp. NKC19-16]
MIDKAVKMNGFNKDIDTQKVILKDILNLSEDLRQALKTSQLELKNYYIGAGFLVQTVWNYLSGNSLDYGIGDIDIVYFDAEDLSFEKEKEMEVKLTSLLNNLPFKVDVKNEARVHLWYEEKFGFKIEPYQSLEEAINTWPTTATSMGVRNGENDQFEVYAPYGLNDLFGMIVRPNKLQITREIYEKKLTNGKNCGQNSLLFHGITIRSDLLQLSGAFFE